MDHTIATAPTTANPSRSNSEITASLNFIRRQDTKPVFHSAALTGGEMKYFFETEDQSHFGHARDREHPVC